MRNWSVAKPITREVFGMVSQHPLSFLHQRGRLGGLFR
jgi:hypothetical protein